MTFPQPSSWDWVRISGRDPKRSRARKLTGHSALGPSNDVHDLDWGRGTFSSLHGKSPWIQFCEDGQKHGAT